MTDPTRSRAAAGKDGSDRIGIDLPPARGKGVLYGVSVGPGDPELITLKAVRVIGQCPIVAVPDIGNGRRTAFSIVSDLLGSKRVLDCSTPMARDRTRAEASYDRIADDVCAALDRGESVAYVTLGDASVYSTFSYIRDRVAARGYETEVVPGVTSFCASAAKLGVSLCDGAESLVVESGSALYEGRSGFSGATRVYLKSGSRLAKLRDDLAERGELDDASMVSDCGLPTEAVHLRFADADLSEGVSYFSTVIVKHRR